MLRNNLILVSICNVWFLVITGSRGKKHHKKKKKALVKLMLWGTVIKGKIELLLKILSAHLQIKFFLIAFVGLLINIARFWIDIKKSHAPQKVRTNLYLLFIHTCF